MVLWKTVGRSFSVAAIGLALSGVAVGQVGGPGLGNGSVDPDAQIDANATADAAAAADTNATSNVDKTLGAQTDGVQLGSDATAGTNRPNLNTDVQSNSSTDVSAQQNRIEGLQTSNAATNLNPFGATFDSKTTRSPRHPGSSAQQHSISTWPANWGSHHWLQRPDIHGC